MGDPRKWTPRKQDSVRRANAARDRAALAEVTIYAWGPTNFLGMHPCATERMGLTPKAKCYGCGRVQEFTHVHVVQPKFAHRPWVELLGSFVCGTCGSRPTEIAFHSKAVSNPSASGMGRISVHPPPKGAEPPSGTSLAHDPAGRARP